MYLSSHPRAHAVKECQNTNICRTSLTDEPTCGTKHHTHLCYRCDKGGSKETTLSLPTDPIGSADVNL